MKKKPSRRTKNAIAKQEPSDATASKGNSKGRRSTNKRTAKKENSRSKRKKSQVDDLTMIEGIGPKTAEKLSGEGITSYSDLGALSEKELREMLDSFGPRFAGRDCSTWRHQAKLAASGKRDSLEKLQSELVGGRRPRGKRRERDVRVTEGKPKPRKYTRYESRKPASEQYRARIFIESGRPRSASHPHPLEKVVTGAEFLEELHQRKDDLEKEKKRVEKACKEFKTEIESGVYGKVQSCAADFRQKLGRIVSPLRYVIVVAVPYKIVDDQLDRGGVRRIPSEFEGIQVKVVECRPQLLSSSSPPDTVFPTNATDFSQTILLGGLPCSEDGDENNWGTLGICFTQDGDHFGIVNAHFARHGEDMIQPPDLPNMFDKNKQIIGEIDQSEPLTDVSGGGTIDAATIKLDLGDRTFMPNLIADIDENEYFEEDVFFAGDRLKPLDLFPVFKVGARTNLTEGIISNANYNDLEIDGITLKSVIRFVDFDDNTLVDCGDSGSVLVAKIDQDSLLVVGLVFANDRANRNVGFACHFADIIQEFSLDIDNILFRDDWGDLV